MNISITAPTASVPALVAWLAELAREAGSSLFILHGTNGKTDVRLERGTHGRYDAVVECDVPFSDEFETAAYQALLALETAGTHTVRRTDRGVRAFLRASWTRRYEGRQNADAPQSFDPEACRPWHCQPLPERPKPKKAKVTGKVWKGFKHPLTPRPYTPPPRVSAPDPWLDEELDAIGG